MLQRLAMLRIHATCMTFTCGAAAHAELFSFANASLYDCAKPGSVLFDGANTTPAHIIMFTCTIAAKTRMRILVRLS
jgi:hypothetical protein